MSECTIRTVLVEDNLGDVYLVGEALAQSNLRHEMKVFMDGAQAKDYFLSCGLNGELAPELIILDLNLPMVTGGELLKLVRSTAALEEVPIVVLSTSDAPEDRALADKTHSAIYITKPSDLDSFLNLGRRIREFWQEWARMPKPVIARG